MDKLAAKFVDDVVVVSKTENASEYVREAFENSKEFIPFVLNGAFEKHGNTANATGSHFVSGFDNQSETEAALFDVWCEEGRWRIVSGGDVADSGIMICEAQLTDSEFAVYAASPLELLPATTPCKVVSLGNHPTLVTVGSDISRTSVVTAIILMDGGSDPDLAELKDKLDGKPLIVTWFPGEALEPSRPECCAEGEILTAGEALKKGWKVVTHSDDIQLLKELYPEAAKDL